MIELKIDGLDVDINQSANIAVTHAIADIEEPDNSSAGFSKSVELPLTPRNMRVFGFINELYSKDQFNNNLHAAEYLVDGVCVMSGVAQVDKVSFKFGGSRRLIGGSFHVSIIGAAFEWITNAKKQLNELQSDEAVIYNIEEVRTNSVREDTTLIKFFPVDRGAFWKENIDGNMIPRTVLDLKDFHPFFNVWKTLCLILSGHTVRSSMEEYFKRLYCSGYMPVNEDLSYIKEDNDFYIGTSATKDNPVIYRGVGFETPIVVANIYNLWKSDEYHNDKGVINSTPPSSTLREFTEFRPTETATVRIETNLHYATQIINGSTGFWNDILREYGECLYIDEFRLYAGGQFEKIILTLDKCVEAKDREGDKSNVFIPAKENEDLTYVVYLKLNNLISTSGGSPLLWNYSGATTQIGGYKRGGNWYVVNAPKGSGGGYFQPGYSSPNLDDRWVDEFYYFEIYDGKVTFNLEDVAKNAYTLNKGYCYPLYGSFSCSRGYGLTPGNRRVGLWLCENNNIKPDFTNIIGLNDKVSISAVGGTDTQLDFIAALRQMFNLMFYTNQISKEVYIEPRTKFYAFDQTGIVNWKDKIDYSKEIEIEELGADAGNSIKLGYTDGNDVVQYYNWKNKTELGTYNESLLNKTTNEAKEIINSIFAPFILRNVESVGMLIPQDQPDKNQDEISEVNLDITPIMGYFAGLSDRTTGEDREIYPKYPQLVFQDAAKNVNLGFGDIITDSIIQGLHQYYEDNITAYNYGRRITIYLKLNAQDVEAIQFPNRLMRDLRGVYLLNIDGEDVPCLLESIEDYNPAKGASTKCKFIIFPDVKLSSPTPTPPPPIDPAMIVITYDDTVITHNDTALGYRINKED